jgi:hypothetical protein
MLNLLTEKFPSIQVVMLPKIPHIVGDVVLELLAVFGLML